ncbi:MAG: DUF2336 domain-containing protein [Alphaproteobacteria bacterium]|nr:DUF2336 domain-containing protein [Alphaproteobacteria bacterium]
MATQLTKADVERLLTNPAPDERAKVAGKIGLDLDSTALTDSELSLAQDIIRILAQDVAVVVRESLALSIRKAQRVPPDVAKKLAHDVEQVALPILQDSTLLSEQDLVEIIRQGSEQKQVAVAKRAVVSESVSAALVEKGSEKVVTTLVANEGAMIAEQSYEKALDKFSAKPEFQEAIVTRKKLPPTVAEKLVNVVSNRLKDYLVSHHELSPQTAADLIMQSRERATIGLVTQASDHDLEKLIQQLIKNERLTPSLIMRALCMGDVGFFEVAMAELSQVPLINARILIHDAGALGLRSLYQKSGLPMAFFGVVRTALAVVHETGFDGGTRDLERYRQRVLERILTHCDDLEPDDANYLLDKLADLMQAA